MIWKQDTLMVKWNSLMKSFKAKDIECHLKYKYGFDFGKIRTLHQMPLRYKWKPDEIMVCLVY